MFGALEHLLQSKNNIKDAVTGISVNKIKWIRSLHQKKFRDELELFLIEGEKLVQEAIQFTPNAIQFIAHTSDFEFKSTSIESIVVSNSELTRISSLKSPNKVLAVVKKLNNHIKVKSTGLTLALDGIQDPGNFGTILRIADWFGINELVCSNDTVEIYNPKVVQSSMGAIFRINIHYKNLSDWLEIEQRPIYGALLEGKNTYQETLNEDAILLIGNEGKGISKDLIPLITHPLTIPSFGQAESLNVAVAAGILVSEFRRR
jgi:TrmH family RNA methyltransferase